MSRKQYENGLSPDQILVNLNQFGETFLLRNLIYTFDTNAASRANQDVGS
jgi:hypothetical protein